MELYTKENQSPDLNKRLRNVDGVFYRELIQSV